MSNGPKLGIGLSQRPVLTQTQTIYLAPFMTPRLRRSRADRPPPPAITSPWRR